MRWLEILAFADDDFVAQQRVVDTALAALRQINDNRLHACVVSTAPSARSLCQMLDDFGIAVSDDLAQELGVVHLGVEAAWLDEQRARVGANEPMAGAMHLQPRLG
jgi:hypothetical protein